MRLDSYKNFLRMCIKDDILTVYPVGLEKCPERDYWEVNYKYSKNNQNEPEIVPKIDLNQILIEEPIVINGSNIS